MNFTIVALAAFIPPVLGFFWYHRLFLGKAWMRTSNLRQTDLAHQNKVMLYAITYVFSFMMAMILQMLVIHQLHLYSILAGNPDMQKPDSVLSHTIKDFMSLYGRNYRTFKHGAFHGIIAGLFMALPIVGINAIFERKSFSYIAIHTGFWMVSLALMGGVICQFA